MAITVHLRKEKRDSPKNQLKEPGEKKSSGRQTGDKQGAKW